MNAQVKHALRIFGLLLALMILASCAGQDGKDGKNGVNGIDGSNGQDGSNGRDGADGQDGKDGADAPEQFTFVMPCAANPNAPTNAEMQDTRLELLFKTKDGMLLGSVSENVEGRLTRLSPIKPGTYMSTGAITCIFSVDEFGVIRR